jgi:hypothetical protein
MSPERIRISAKAAPQSSSKTPRTLERDAVFRTPNPKGLRYTLSSPSPRTPVTHKAPSPPHNRELDPKTSSPDFEIPQYRQLTEASR